ncbi:MAG: ATP-binding protein [Desulfonauticus sp.]|nr:ATP-binding protein [Desulfonauticus sp.]
MSILKKIKNKIQNFSLKNKIFLSIISMLIFISVIIALLSRWILISSLTKELNTRGLAIGQSIAERGREYVLERNYPKLLSLIFDEAKLKERHQLIAYIFIVNAKGQIMAHTFIKPFPKVLKTLLRSQHYRNSDKRLVTLDGKRIFDISVPITEGIYRIGTVHIGLNKSHIDGLIAKLRITFLGFISLVIIFTFWVSHYLSETITKPLYLLTEAAQAISKGNFDISLGRDEYLSKCPAFSKQGYPCWHLDESNTSKGKTSSLHKCPECVFYKKTEGDELDKLRNAFVSMIWSIKLYRKRLKESEEKYRSLFISAPDPIFVISVNNLKILDLNPRVEEVYNYSVEELKGKKFSLLWPEIKDFFKEDSPLFQKGYLYINRAIHFKKNNKPFFVNVQACPISYEQKEAVILTTNDITEIVEKDAQIIQAGKMKALGEMAAGIAHEVNQPLNTIKLGADLLAFVLSGQASLPKEEIISVAKDLSEQVKRASTIINDLRQFSRKSDLMPEQVNLNKVIYSVLSLLKQQLILNDIDVVLNLEDNIPPIQGYENRLQQVFFNLINNAKDAILEKRLQTKANFRGKIKITSKTSQDGVFVYVEDNGIGIKNEDKTKIFEPFFTTKGKGKGMGLGLAIVKSIINDHKGTINLIPMSSGVLFKLWFPKIKGVNNVSTNKSVSD